MDNNFLPRFRIIPFFVTSLGFLLCLFGVLGLMQSPPEYLFGIFRITFFHSLFFIFLGIIIILARRKNTRRSVTLSLLIIGYIFLGLAVWGMLRLDDKESVYIFFRLFSLNYADNIMHVSLSITSLLFGYSLRKK